MTLPSKECKGIEHPLFVALLDHPKHPLSVADKVTFAADDVAVTLI